MDISPASALVWGIVVMWLAITLLSQHDFFSKAFGGFGIARVIPRWTFFAPNPGVTDYHIVVRDRLPNGTTTGWKHVPFAQGRTSVDLIWNHRKRSRKVLHDSVQMLRVCAVSSGCPKGELFSLPYILLLRYSVVSVPPQTGAVRQFAVIESRGHSARALEATYVSSFHKVP